MNKFFCLYWQTEEFLRYACIFPVRPHPYKLQAFIYYENINPKNSSSRDSLPSTGCQKSVVFFITLTNWWWGYGISLQRPSSPTSLPEISHLSGRELCFDSGHCATGIWVVIFPGLDRLGSVAALSCCQASAANERPPRSALEINFNLTRPGGPDTRTRWYLWYGMSSRHLCQKHPMPLTWPRHNTWVQERQLFDWNRNSVKSEVRLQNKSLSACFHEETPSQSQSGYHKHLTD